MCVPRARRRFLPGNPAELVDAVDDPWLFDSYEDKRIQTMSNGTGRLNGAATVPSVDWKTSEGTPCKARSSDVSRGVAATTGGVLVGGPLQALVAKATGAAPPSADLVPVADLRDGIVRLHVREGFQYRSFHDTDGPPVALTDGTVLPGRHDGMGAFPGLDGNVWLVRNHELNNPGPASARVTQRRTTPWPRAAPPRPSSRLTGSWSTPSPA